jgi:hypothetical protein
MYTVYAKVAPSSQPSESIFTVRETSEANQILGFLYAIYTAHFQGC